MNLNRSILGSLSHRFEHFLNKLPRRRWEENIKMDLKEIDINTRNWVDSAQVRN